MNLMITRRMMALAALLASIVMVACGLRSTNPSSETLTVYQDAPTMTPLDLGPPGNSPGDVYYFSAPLHSSPGGPVTGEVFGSKTLKKVATGANPSFEQRATLLIFTFGNRDDQIVAMGVHDYPPDAAEFDAGQPHVRAILGGTGKYMDARGQLASMRNADGSYTQVLRCSSDANRIPATQFRRINPCLLAVADRIRLVTPLAASSASFREKPRSTDKLRTPLAGACHHGTCLVATED